MVDESAPSTLASQDPLLPVTGLIEGFTVSADGTTSLVEDAATAEPPDGGFLWLHLNVSESGELVEKELGLDPMVVRSLLAKETRPRCQHLRGGILINLRGANLNAGQRPENMISVRCYLEANRLITVRLQRSVAVEDMRENYRAGQAHDRPSQLLIEMIRRLISLLDPIVDGIADSLDALEHEATRQGDDERLKNQISAIRHDSATYRRYLAPMRDAILKLGSRQAAGITSADLDELHEEGDRAMRIVEELDITIERAGVIVDQMDAARDEKMNRNMMLLSVISAVFLPLGFLTGLLGINVGGLPGTDDPQAFTIVVVICLVVGVGAGVFFKARDWI
ncbi:MAG: CorA family divalent cation transporter [Pseudomonadota bacterium]